MPALRLLGSIRAGEQWTGPALQPGEAIEIMTGAPVPAGADAVRMLEHVELLRKARYAPLPASRCAPGRTSFRAVRRHVPATRCCRPVRVWARRSWRWPRRSARRSSRCGRSRSWQFSRRGMSWWMPAWTARADADPELQLAWAGGAGARAMVASPCCCRRLQTRERHWRLRLRACATRACCCLSGGVSAGKYDLVEEVLLTMGAEFFFTGVKIQPGKPAVFGRLPARWVRWQSSGSSACQAIPVSTQVTATLFALPLLRALGGEAASGPVFAGAVLTETVAVRPGLTRFLPARMESSLDGATVRPTGWQGSGDLHSNARANCYLVVPPAVESLDAGCVLADGARCGQPASRRGGTATHAVGICRRTLLAANGAAVVLAHLNRRTGDREPHGREHARGTGRRHRSGHDEFTGGLPGGREARGDSRRGWVGAGAIRCGD